MVRTAILSSLAGASSLLTSTQLAAAGGLEDQVGGTAATIISLGWLGILAVLALAIIVPMLRH
jgi:hypothetical protein